MARSVAKTASLTPFLLLASVLHLALFLALGKLEVKASPHFPFKTVNIRLADTLQRKISASLQPQPNAAKPKAAPVPTPTAKPAPPEAQNADAPKPKTRPTKELHTPLWEKEELWQRSRSKGERFKPVARTLDEYVARGDSLKGLAAISPESDEAVRLRYTQVLSLWLYKFREYPEAAKQAGLKGQGILRIRIDRTGRILFYQLDQSTGHPILDQAIRDTVFRASPVPEVPAHFPGGSQLEFVMDMRFIPD